MGTEFADRAARPERDSAADLALVGEIAALLDARRFLDTLDAALRRLQEYSRADAGELFLAAPTGEEVFLVSHQGRDIAVRTDRDYLVGLLDAGYEVALERARRSVTGWLAARSAAAAGKCQDV